MITLRPGECGSQGAVKLSYALVSKTWAGHFSVKVLQIPQNHYSFVSFFFAVDRFETIHSSEQTRIT